MTALWQLLSLVVGVSHKNKLRGRRKDAAADETVGENKARLPETPKDYLPPADVENVVPPSVVEDTTRRLDKARFK